MDMRSKLLFGIGNSNPETPIANPALSESERRAVLQLTPTDLRAIDNCILSQCSDRWVKIARVVLHTERKLENDYPSLSYLFYAERVVHLGNNGDIETKGNSAFMRFSEVRLKQTVDEKAPQLLSGKNMTTQEAEKLSMLFHKISADLNQSVAYVQDHDSGDAFLAYRRVVGNLMGSLYDNAMEPLWQRFPELRPDNLGGTYKVSDTTYEPLFYDYIRERKLRSETEGLG